MRQALLIVEVVHDRYRIMFRVMYALIFCKARQYKQTVLTVLQSFQIANAVKEGQITHYGQPALDASATKTTKRRIGNNGGWGFQSTDEADATLIEACALAYWGAMTTKRRPGRKAVVF